MNNTRMSKLSAFICLTMIVGMFGFLANAKEAFAAVTRVAVVTEIEGTVKVKKSGGTKSFNAFKNMSLNEGDAITTGKGASIVLELASSKAEQDEITIGENSQVNFSKLEDQGGTKAKMNVWAGSLWVKVKSISNADDTFEVETPTAIMGVRGTNFFQRVDPITGQTSLIVASGVVRASTTVSSGQEQEVQRSTQDPNFVNVYPAQQITLDSRSEVGDLKTKIDIVNIEDLVGQASPKIIEKIIKNAAEIQAENEKTKQELSERLNSGNTNPVSNANLLIRDMNDLNRVNANIDNIVGNIAKQAADSKKLESANLNKIIDEANQKITDPNKKIDLNKVQPIDKTAGLDPEVQAAKQAALEAQQRYAEEQRKLIENQQRLAALLNKILEDKKRIEEANRKALEEAAKKAAEQLKAQLDAAARARFEADQKQREQEKKPSPATQQPGTGGGTGTVTTPKVGLGFTDPTLASGVTSSHINKPIDLNVSLGGFGSGKQIYGYQIAVEFDETLVEFNEAAFGKHDNGVLNEYRNLASNPFKVELASGWQAPAGHAIDAVDHYFVQANPGKDVLNYAVLKYAGSAVTVSDNVVVKLPFILRHLPASSGNISFKLTLTPVDSAGNIIEGTAPVTLDLRATV